VKLVRDKVSGVSRGIAFVEFPAVEYAAHSLQQATQMQLQIDRSPLKISFARDAAVMAMISQAVRSLFFLAHDTVYSIISSSFLIHYCCIRRYQHG